MRYFYALFFFLLFVCDEIRAMRITFHVINKGTEVPISADITVDTQKKEVEFNLEDGYHKTATYTTNHVSSGDLVLLIAPNIIRIKGRNNKVEDITVISLGPSFYYGEKKLPAGIMLKQDDSDYYYQFIATDNDSFDSSFKKLVRAFGITSDNTDSKVKGNSSSVNNKRSAASTLSAISNSASSSSSNSSSSTNRGSSRSSSLQTSKDGNMNINKLSYFMLDERGLTTPSDFNIFNLIDLTVRNARGKKVWVEFKYVNDDTSQALTAVNGNYQATNGAAGTIISFVSNSDNYHYKNTVKVPMGALGLGNGSWNIMVMPFVYVGTFAPNIPSTTLGPVKVLHFSKYGENVSEMTVTDKF